MINKSLSFINIQKQADFKMKFAGNSHFMQRNRVSKMINRISRQESLPLLRGMFVFPTEVRRMKGASVLDFIQISSVSNETSGTIARIGKLMQQDSDFSCVGEEGLYITREEALYLG